MTAQARDLKPSASPSRCAHVFIDESVEGYTVAFQPKNGPAWRSRRLKSAFDAEIAADVLAEFLERGGAAMSGTLTACVIPTPPPGLAGCVQYANDRANIVARSITMMIAAASDRHTLEPQLTALLRNEFEEIKQQTVNEIRLTDE